MSGTELKKHEKTIHEEQKGERKRDLSNPSENKSEQIHVDVMNMTDT